LPGSTRQSIVLKNSVKMMDARIKSWHDAGAGMSASSQFQYCARNLRNESCGLSTLVMTQPSGPFTTMKFSVTERPPLRKATAT
jgi:hypothetical protein